MNSVDLTADGLEPPSWLPDAAVIAEMTFRAAGVSDWDISILLCEDQRITELNTTYRNIDDTTDVLTFSQTEGVNPPGIDNSIRAGDVVISIPCVERNAAENGVSRVEEFVRVLVHGYLHLAGFDHAGVDMSSPSIQNHPMLALQERLVSSSIEEIES